MPDNAQTPVDVFGANTVAAGSNPKIVTLPDGNLLVTYASPIGASGHCIRGQQLDAAGNGIGTELTFVFDRIGTPEFDVFVHSEGPVVIVAGTGDQCDSPEGDTGLQARTYELSDGGDVLPSKMDRLVNVGPEAKACHPAFAELGGGGYKVFYAGHLFEVDALRVAPVADHRRDVGPIAAFGGGCDATTSADTLSDGNTVAILDRAPDKSPDAGIGFRIVRPGGSIAKTGELDGGARAFGPTVRALADGGFVVAWAEPDRTSVEDAKQGADVCFQMFDATGNPTTGRKLVGDIAAIDESIEPAISPLNDGGFTLFHGNDRDIQGILGQRFDADGTPVGERFFTFLGTGGQPDATALPNGRFAVAAARDGNIEVRVFGVRDAAISGADDDADDDTEGDDGLV